MLKILLLLSLISCAQPIPKKMLIPRPVINEIVFEFKDIKSQEDIDILYYNVQLARIYYNQQTMNLQMTQDYYSNVVKNLGGVEEQAN